MAPTLDHHLSHFATFILDACHFQQHDSVIKSLDDSVEFLLNLPQESLQKRNFTLGIFLSTVCWYFEVIKSF